MVEQTRHELITELEETGYLKKMIDKGLVSYAPVAHKEIYEMYLEEKRRVEKSGFGVNQAVHNVAVSRGISERSIFRIIKEMEG